MLTGNRQDVNRWDTWLSKSRQGRREQTSDLNARAVTYACSIPAEMGSMLYKWQKKKNLKQKLKSCLQRSRWAWGLEKYLNPLGACYVNMRTQVRSSVSTYSVRWVAHTWNHGKGELETGWDLGSLANQPSLTGELPVRPWLKNKADGTRERTTPVVRTRTG